APVAAGVRRRGDGDDPVLVNPSFPKRPGPARERVADQIVEDLRSAISTGTLATGSKLPTQRELATRYSASATTIREAARLRSPMGLIEVRGESGAYA